MARQACWRPCAAPPAQHAHPCQLRPGTLTPPVSERHTTEQVSAFATQADTAGDTRRHAQHHSGLQCALPHSREGSIASVQLSFRTMFACTTSLSTAMCVPAQQRGVHCNWSADAHGHHLHLVQREALGVHRVLLQQRRPRTSPAPPCAPSGSPGAQTAHPPSPEQRWTLITGCIAIHWGKEQAACLHNVLEVSLFSLI